MSALTNPDDARVRELLERVEKGDHEARGELLALFYDDLRERAHALLRGRRGQSLQTTALAHEACVRLLHHNGAWGDREHFLCSAARAMRCVLVDRARSRSRDKRRATGERVPLDDMVVVYEEHGIDLPRLDDATARLAKFDPLMARAVELRFFAALDIEETAQVLGLSRRTFDRRWAATKAWLRAALEE